jgi:aspartyl-tRNA(Asn)/glutamyl-tRNA(Gln) amidotransferase subunit C
MSLDKKTVAKVANLARLEFADADLERLRGELNHILSFVEQLNEVNIEGLEPMTSVVEIALPMREDVVSDGDRAAEILANAPAAERGFFVVPKVVE